MGTTCASLHALWPGSVADAAKAASRAYTKLGYERLRKMPAEGGKQVILLARAGEHCVSVYDSTNADLGSGELKDVAVGVSKLLKTGAVFASLYDSDSYEFIVFNNGRYIDLLMPDAESYSGPLKHLTSKSRATQWARIFGSFADDAADRPGGRATYGVCRRHARCCGLTWRACFRGRQPVNAVTAC